MYRDSNVTWEEGGGGCELGRVVGRGRRGAMPIRARQYICTSTYIHTQTYDIRRIALPIWGVHLGKTDASVGAWVRGCLCDQHAYIHISPGLVMYAVSTNLMHSLHRPSLRRPASKPGRAGDRDSSSSSLPENSNAATNKNPSCIDAQMCVASGADLHGSGEGVIAAGPWLFTSREPSY